MKNVNVYGEKLSTNLPPQRQASITSRISTIIAQLAIRTSYKRKTVGLRQGRRGAHVG
jgi:hypothetical protein